MRLNLYEAAALRRTRRLAAFAAASGLLLLAPSPACSHEHDAHPWEMPAVRAQLCGQIYGVAGVWAALAGAQRLFARRRGGRT